MPARRLCPMLASKQSLEGTVMRFLLGASGAEKYCAPSRHPGRIGTAWRASFDLSAASRLVRPLNFTVRSRMLIRAIAAFVALPGTVAFALPIAIGASAGRPVRTCGGLRPQFWA